MANITHIFKTYFPNTQGGLEEAIRQIAKFSIQKGFSVKVVSVSKNPFQGELEGIHCKSYCHSFGSNSLPISLDLICNFKKEIGEADILHLQFPWPPGELLTLLFNKNKPIVITFHCDIHNRKLLRMIYSPFLKFLFKRANVIVPTSENLMNSTPILGNFKNKCKPINLWLDESRFANLSDPDDSFQNKVKTFGAFCLFVGVLRWYKGLDVLLDAAKSIKNNIVIVGKGPLFCKLQKRIENEGINNVFLLGYQSDDRVKFLLKKCRMVVLPSVSPAEAFGQILLEASYFGKPMISTELGTGTSYVNIHNQTGFVVKANDSKELEKSCNRLFQDIDMSNKFGANANKRLYDHFIQDVQGPKYIEIYNELLGSKKD